MKKGLVPPLPRRVSNRSPRRNLGDFRIELRAPKKPTADEVRCGQRATGRGDDPRRWAPKRLPSDRDATTPARRDSASRAGADSTVGADELAY